MLRIAYREVSGLAGFIETTQDITDVAERCVNRVYQFAFDLLTKKWGTPNTGFGILAMGKFGGRELNYSSDIDLIFLYTRKDYSIRDLVTTSSLAASAKRSSRCS